MMDAIQAPKLLNPGQTSAHWHQEFRLAGKVLGAGRLTLGFSARAALVHVCGNDITLMGSGLFVGLSLYSLRR